MALLWLSGQPTGAADSACGGTSISLQFRSVRPSSAGVFLGALKIEAPGHGAQLGYGTRPCRTIQGRIFLRALATPPFNPRSKSTK